MNQNFTNFPNFGSNLLPDEAFRPILVSKGQICLYFPRFIKKIHFLIGLYRFYGHQEMIEAQIQPPSFLPRDQIGFRSFGVQKHQKNQGPGTHNADSIGLP